MAEIGMLDIYIDGACQPNPGGHTSYGVVVKHMEDTIYKESGYLGESPSFSNNVAEYHALIQALSYLKKTTEIYVALIHSDSKLLVEQMEGRRIVRGGKYLPYYNRAKSLVKELLDQRITVFFRWIPKEKNLEANRLAILELSKASTAGRYS